MHMSQKVDNWPYLVLLHSDCLCLPGWFLDCHILDITQSGGWIRPADPAASRSHVTRLQYSDHSSDQTGSVHPAHSQNIWLGLERQWAHIVIYPDHTIQTWLTEAAGHLSTDTKGQYGSIPTCLLHSRQERTFWPFVAYHAYWADRRNEKGTVTSTYLPVSLRFSCELEGGCVDLHVGGLCNALAISGILTITVLIPFPLPSTWKREEQKLLVMGKTILRNCSMYHVYGSAFPSQ